MLDDVHQKILNSLQSMKGNAELFKKLGAAASHWHDKLGDAIDAQADFFAALDAVAHKAHAAPGMNELGVGLNNVADCARGLGELQRDVQRSLSDEVIVPLGARIPVDARNIQRMEKEYFRVCTEQVESIHRAEKDSDKFGKRLRKNPSDTQTMMQLRGAQRAVAERARELDVLRAHTLKRVLTEERARYAKIMVGVLDVLRVQAKLCQRSVPALSAVIQVCQPLCENPGELPRNFNPMQKRGSSDSLGVPMGYASGAELMPQPSPTNGGFSYLMSSPSLAMHGIPPRMPPSMPPPMVPYGQAPFRPPPGSQLEGLKQHQYVARYPFHGQESGQLSFAAGHVIECEGESDDNWQFGTNLQTGRSGWFPVNFLDVHHHHSQGEVPKTAASAGAVALPPVDYDEDGPHPKADDEGDPAMRFDGV